MSKSHPTAEYRCYSCGQKFESLGDMQRHIVTVHLQSGEVPEESSPAANKAGVA